MQAKFNIAWLLGLNFKSNINHTYNFQFQG